jgi:hypothetical protein
MKTMPENLVQILAQRLRNDPNLSFSWNGRQLKIFTGKLSREEQVRAKQLSRQGLGKRLDNACFVRKG